MFFFILLPVGIYSSALLLVVGSLFFHTITTFSSFGRVIMHSGAMGHARIFDANYEVTLLPHDLHNNLLTKACANLSNNTSIMRQYRSKQTPIDRTYSQDELSNLFLSSDRLTSVGSSRSSSTSNSAAGFDGPQQVAPPTPLQQPPTMTIQKPAPARLRTGSLVRFADGCDTSGYPRTNIRHDQQDGKVQPKSLLSSLSAAEAGHYGDNSSNSGRDSKINVGSHHSTRCTNNSFASKHEPVVVQEGNEEHLPLLQEWLQSSNNRLPLFLNNINESNNNNNNTSPTTRSPYLNGHATWTTASIALPHHPPVSKTVSSNYNKLRPSKQQQQQHAGYGAVTATTVATTATAVRGTTNRSNNSNGDPFVEKNAPSREVGNRVYSVVSELSVDDNLLVEDKVGGVEDEDDDDNGFEEEYGFDPVEDALNGDEEQDEEATTGQEELEIVLGLTIETDDSILSEPQQKRPISNGHEQYLHDAESGRTV
jgi:hypothetical protein